MSVSSGKCDRTEKVLPGFAKPCHLCLPKCEKVLPTDLSRRYPDEYNVKLSTWLKYKDMELEQGKWTSKMTEHHGARAELIGEIMDKYQDWAFHRYGSCMRPAPCVPLTGACLRRP